MNYKHLTKEDRIQIGVLIKTNHSITTIARILERSKSTISRELIRNKDPNLEFQYHYTLAHKKTLLRRRKANQARIKINIRISKLIHSKLLEKWSPEQISGRFKIDSMINTSSSDKSNTKSKITSSPIVSISYQTIYNHIYLHHKDWIKHLRILGTKGKYRRKYGTRIREALREASKKKRIDIRPIIIDQRTR